MIVVKIKYNFRCFWEEDEETRKKKRIDLSCSPDPCFNGGQCSTRLNGNYHCECINGFIGVNCTNGYFFSFFFHSFFLILDWVFYGFCFKNLNFFSLFFFGPFIWILISLSYFIFILFSKIGDQKILMDWYNSLDSKGKLDWDGINDLCQQSLNLISCDSSTKRINYM